MSARVAMLAFVVLMMFLAVGCIGDASLEVRGAYCDNNGHFNFTLKNHDDTKRDLHIRWTLNDPKADEPVLRGSDNATLRKGEARPFSYTLNYPEYADMRFLVMYVKAFEDGEEVLDYREQKSPYDWDYSTLPPKRVD